MIDRLFDDTLWIYTSILGAVAGAAFLAYFKETKAGIWAYAKLDQGLDYLVAKFGWTWLEQPEDAWRKKYPKITHKIDQMEQKIKELENELAKK